MMSERPPSNHKDPSTMTNKDPELLPCQVSDAMIEELRGYIKRAAHSQACWGYGDHTLGKYVRDNADIILTAMTTASTIPTDGDGLHPLTLSEVADQQFDAAIEASFRHGAQTMREMLARFVENSPPTDLKVMAGSIRANWYPAWGDDPGQASELPRNALGDTDERDARHSRFAARAVDHAMKLLEEEGDRLSTIPSAGNGLSKMDADFLRYVAGDPKLPGAVRDRLHSIAALSIQTISGKGMREALERFRDCVPVTKREDGCPWCLSKDHWAGRLELCPSPASRAIRDALAVDQGERG